MKTLLLNLIIGFSLPLLVSCASSGSKGSASGMSGHSGVSIGSNYKYNELMIKDYDEMLEMVQSFVLKAKEAAGEDGTSNEDEAVSHLRNGLKFIFSRPDSDNMVAKLVPEVRRMMLGFNAYEPSVSMIADEALEAVSSRNAAPSIQSTSLFILDNILAEVRPEVGANTQLKAVVERIRDARITISKDVLKERKIRGMFETKNPSAQAAKILKAFEPKKK